MVSPKLALSPVTLPQCSFEEAFAVTAEAGFAGIGLRYDRFEQYLQQGGCVANVRQWLRRFGLVFSEAAFLAEWQFHGGIPLVSQRQRGGGPDERQPVLLQRLHRFLAHCEELECGNVTAVPALREVGALDIAAEEFAALCDIARPYGVRLCLEFMGTAPQLDTIRAGAEFVAAAGRPNGGLLVDSFLFHQGNSDLQDLAATPRDAIFAVQLADAKPKPRSELNMLEDRLLPGEGSADLKAIIETLQRIGYDGWWTVEIFNPAFAGLPAGTLAKQALEAAIGVLGPALRDRP